MTAFLAWFTGQRLALLAGGLGLVGVVLLGRGVVRHIQQDAVTQVLVAHDDSVIARAAYRIDTITKVLAIDTVRLTHDTTIYRIAHDTVLRHLTDTLLVKQFVTAADTTIHACTRALNDCAQVTAALRLELAAATDKSARLVTLEPTYLQRHVGVVALVSALAGAYLGSRLK